MRLLNTQTWEMKEFISEDQVPPYAILSHTWDDEEVTFQQWEARAQADITHLQGYKKIKTFCIKAAENGFQWVWIDTYALSHPAIYQSELYYAKEKTGVALTRRAAPS